MNLISNGDGGSRRALIVQHAPEAGPGTLEQTLRGRGFQLEWWWAARDLQPPAPATDYDLIISLGGPGNPEDESTTPWAPAERVLIKEALDQHIAFLGICMGAQLLAQVAGGSIRSDAPPAKGWTPLRLTDAGQRDPLIGALPRFLHAFHWHDLSFTGGPASALLATSDTAEEAIHIPPTGWGLQFHPCLNLPVAAAWIEMERKELQDIGVNPEELREETVVRMREYEAYGPHLANRIADIALAEGDGLDSQANETRRLTRKRLAPSPSGRRR
jgi:GMP synthase-like glutamine amidotransferase